MATISYDPTIDYNRLFQLANGDNTKTVLSKDNTTVTNTSVTQAALDQAMLDYQNGVVPLSEKDDEIGDALTVSDLAKSILGDPSALSIVATSTGRIDPTVVQHNPYAPPMIPDVSTANTLTGAKKRRKTVLELEFYNHMSKIINVKGFNTNTLYPTIHYLYTNMALMSRLKYSTNIMKDASGNWSSIKKSDVSRIKTTMYKHYRDNLELLYNSHQAIDSATNIPNVNAITVTWKIY